MFKSRNNEDANRRNHQRQYGNNEDEEENKEDNRGQNARSPYIFDNDDLQTLQGDRYRSRERIHNRRHQNPQQIDQQQDPPLRQEIENTQLNNHARNGRNTYHIRSYSNMITTNNNIRNVIGSNIDEQNNERNNDLVRRNRTPENTHGQGRENREGRIPLERIRNPEVAGILLGELTIVQNKTFYNN